MTGYKRINVAVPVSTWLYRKGYKKSLEDEGIIERSLIGYTGNTQHIIYQ